MNPIATIHRTAASVVPLALGAVLAVPAGAQQTGQITGLVRGAESLRPLDGAQVLVEGTGIGSLANRQGRYLIPNVPAGEYALRVTLIGYATAEQPVSVTSGGTATVDFSLSETALALDAIVVTATAGEVRVKEVGNSLDAVTLREIEQAPVINSQDVLQGRAPGVTILSNSGQPGSGGTVKIRGMNSVSQTNEPLIYVDGVRIFNLPTGTGGAARTSVNPLQDIPAEDIERVEVVKGAAATTLYGTEASGGVIQIFTKRGVSGSAMWTAEAAVGLLTTPSFLNDPSGDPTDLYTNCGNLDDLYSLNVQVDNTDPEFGDRIYLYDPTCPKDGTWKEGGRQGSYALSVRGGIGDVTYYMSGTYANADGTLPTSNSKDGGFRGNFSFTPLENLSFQLSSAYTKRKTRWVPDGNNADGFLLNVGRGVQNYLKGGKGDDCLPANIPLAPDGSTRTCVTNGYLFDAELFTHVDHFITGLTTQYDPTPSFSNRFSVGWDYLHVRSESFQPFGHLRTPEGQFGDDITRHTKLSLDYTGSLRISLPAEVVSTVSWGGQIFQDRHRLTGLSFENFAGSGRPTIETGAALTGRNETNISSTSAGFFFQEMLGWRDQLFVTGGLRIDGNSAFGENYGLQYYPKVSASYIVSDHDFWPTGWFETFKLRGALGASGKAPSAFAKIRTWTGIGLEGEPGVTPGDPGNDEVGPERTLEWEAGLDASLLQGRFGAEVTYFRAKTTDALINRDLPGSEGFLNNRTTNVGEIENEGWELQLTAVPVRTEAIDVRLRANMSFNRGEAIDLDGLPDFHTCISADNDAEFCEGDIAPVYTGYRITNPDELADPALDSIVTESGEVIADPNAVIGPAYPTRSIGLGLTLDVGSSLTIDALMEHQGGHYLPNFTGYQNARRGSWFPCFEVQGKMIAALTDPSALADVTALERARCATGDNTGYGHNSEYWIEKADFWKLRHVSLTYRVPENLLAFTPFARSVTLTLSARNLLTITDYSGTDPEVMDFADLAEGYYDGDGDYGRRDYYQIPIPRTFTFAARVSW